MAATSPQPAAITTSSGTLERYDVTSRSLLAPLMVGGSLNWADITPDGAAAYVADGQRTLVQSLVRRVDLTTGATSQLRHNGNGGAWDVEIGSNGVGLVDYDHIGYGFVPLDRLDTASNTLSSSRRSTNQDALLFRGAGRTLLFGVQPNISSGAIFTYDVAASTFPANVNTGVIFTGPGVTASSLDDGNFTLTTQAARVVDAGGSQVDGDGDGTAGGDRVAALFRLFGDANGDRVVNAADLKLFRLFLGATTTDPTFDINGDGVINAADLNAFRVCLGAAI